MSVIINGTSGVTYPDNTLATTAYSTRFRNRIINGDMRIDQRNAGASVTQNTAGIYTVDRWGAYGNVNAKFTVQQSSTSPAGFINSALITSSSAYSVGSSDQFVFYQNIEGLNVADLGWGTADAKTITLSFQVRSSLTGTFGGSIRNSAYDRSYPFSYTISSANTWTSVSVTIAGDTSGTWLKTNGIGLIITLCMGAGSSLLTTGSLWTAGNYVGATGATSVVGTSGATFYITGVQLEVGSSATGFEYVDYTTQLAMCQRYYFRTDASGSTTNIVSCGVESGSIMAGNGGSFPATMRAIPTMTLGSGVRAYTAATGVTAVTVSANRCSTTTMAGSFGISGGSAGQAGTVFNNTTSGYIEFSSEL